MYINKDGEKCSKKVGGLGVWKKEVVWSVCVWKKGVLLSLCSFIIAKTGGGVCDLLFAVCFFLFFPSFSFPFLVDMLDTLPTTVLC